MKLLNDARMQGYASAVRPRRVSDEISISVPIMIDDRVLAAVMIRFSGTAVPLKLAVERFLPKLRETSQKIRQTFIDQQRDSAQLGGRPQLAIARCSSTGVATTLLATSPIFALPIAHYTGHERISARAIAGTVVGLGGIVILSLGRT